MRRTLTNFDVFAVLVVARSVVEVLSVKFASGRALTIYVDFVRARVSYKYVACHYLCAGAVAGITVSPGF
jgi:hypothetical protein